MDLDNPEYMDQGKIVNFVRFDMNNICQAWSLGDKWQQAV